MRSKSPSISEDKSIDKIIYWENSSYSDTKSRQKTIAVKKLEIPSKSITILLMSGKQSEVQEKKGMESTFYRVFSQPETSIS